MAEESKKESGPSESGTTIAQRYTVEIGAAIAAAFALAWLWNKIKLFFETRGLITESSRWNAFFNELYYFIGSATVILIILSNVLSVFLIMGIIYSVVRLREIAAEEKEILYPKTEEGVAVVKNIEVKPSRWDDVKRHISSDVPSDWKLAILEADIILDEMLDKMGYAGSSVGDKLKKIEKSDFQTLDLAWDAHKIRNSIAHEGGAYELNEREARRVVQMYEQVFREFEYI